MIDIVSVSYHLYERARVYLSVIPCLCRVHGDEFYHTVRVSSPANYASGPDEYGQHSYGPNMTGTSRAGGMQGMLSPVEYLGIGTTHSYSTQPYSTSEAQVEGYRHTTQHSGVYGSAKSHAGATGGVEMPVSGGRCATGPIVVCCCR